MAVYTVRGVAPEDVREALKNYPELVRDILYHRGVRTRHEAEQFLHPDYARGVHDPLLMLGMERATGRIMEAIEKKERIVIFADYDHDGIPGGVILSDFFAAAGYKNVHVYIPHRNVEGFGLQKESVEKLAADGAKLIITVDCGITASAPVARARALGIDVIITDHHLSNGSIPEAHAILNPKQTGDTYPFKELCGSGVAFKLVQALTKELKTKNLQLKVIPEGWETSLLDLVAIATIGDMVSLTGENRTLVHAGLMALRKSSRPGLKALVGIAKLDQGHVSEDDVAFMLTPRINAASRMDTPELAFNLLAAKSALEAEPLVTELNHINDQRKGLVASVVKEVHRRLATRPELPEVIVVGDTDWQPGILGLAANAVVEKEGRTAFLWGRGDSLDIRGSCRSKGGVDVVDLMEALPKETFIEMGGHTNSGGFSITSEHLHHLEEQLNEAYRKIYGGEPQKDETVFVDGKLSLGDVRWEVYGELERLAPFGVGNPKPLFMFSGVTIVEVKHFGSDKNHLQLIVGSGGVQALAMSFFNTSGSFGTELTNGMTIDLVATMEKSVFRGTPELRLRIVDIV
ncbi:single-stranded-DNA-specific exonuclease RecJ [Candidatus Wolfebacteria bacterium]|nr:single-stranded-DNA-specific exonuclease RecJ [Candidatus Wolfebacteria bacterium]